MLDIQVRAYPAHNPAPPIEFFRIELTPLAEGRVFVSMTATTVDEEGPDLLDQEIACDKVASIDDVLAFIRSHVTFVARSNKEH